MDTPAAEELAQSLALLHEYVALMLIGDISAEYRYVDRALTALTSFNLAAGFSLAGEEPSDRPEIRRSYARLAVSSVRALDAQNRWDEKRAQRDAEHLGRQLPGAVPIRPVSENRAPQVPAVAAAPA